MPLCNPANPNCSSDRQVGLASRVLRTSRASGFGPDRADRLRMHWSALFFCLRDQGGHFSSSALCEKRPPQLFRVHNWRLTTESGADHCRRLSLAQNGQLRQRFRECGWQILRNDFTGRQELEHGLVKCEEAGRDSAQLFCHAVFSENGCARGSDSSAESKGNIMSSEVAALIPLVVVAVGFEIFCLVDAVRADEVRYLPRWAWIVICLASVPIGGVAYLIFGRER